MKVKFIEIENVLSIGSARLEFGDSGLVLLDGWNYDDDSANGAGKSSIFNALSFGLYDKFPRKISKTEILRRGTKSGLVHVGVEVDGSLLEVKRCRPKNTDYYIDGNKVDITQEEFESKLGVSYTQFLVCMYSAQTEAKKLIALSDTDKKDFILQLMNLDMFSSKKKDVDAKLKSLNESKLEVEKVITQCDSKMSVYREQIVDRDAIVDQISNLNTDKLKTRLNELSSITKPDLSKYDDLREKISLESRKLDKVDAEASVSRSRYSDVKSQLKHLEEHPPSLKNKITCPHCSSEFGLSTSGSAITEKDLIDAYNQKVEELRSVLKQHIDTINQYPDTSSKRSELNELLKKINIKMAEEQSNYRNTIEQIGELKSKIQIREAKITDLKTQLENQDNFSAKIKELKSLRNKADQKLIAISRDMEVYGIISSILSPTGAPAYIVDSTVETFNEKIAEYVAMIWPNASYRLQSFKENKDGGIKAKFSDKLVIAGKDVSIGSLSGGEYRCLSLASDFAIVDVVESVFGNKLTPIVLDEPFEGLDSSNRERVIELLERISQDRQIWVIDHASEAKSMFTDVVRIEKRHGTSSLMI